MLRNKLINLHRRLVMAVGGHDPVMVKNLIYRANVLASCASYARDRDWTPSLKEVAQSQVKAIRMATIKLDPAYAECRGYISKSGGGSTVREVAAVERRTEGTPLKRAS